MCGVSTPRVSEQTFEVVRLGSTVARLKLKGIDGDPHKQRSVWFNSKRREEPYQGLTSSGHSGKPDFLRDHWTGAAWLSSARAVRCWVKSRNERNPYRRLQVSGETAPINEEEGGDDVKSARPLHPGRHTRYNGRKQREANPRGGAKPSKPGLSSDCRLQPACMKVELLVTVSQHITVNTFPGLVHTARHTTKVGNT
jgi:hypothetical protein